MEPKKLEKWSEVSDIEGTKDVERPAVIISSNLWQIMTRYGESSGG
jgi:hypothetical protein